MDWGQPQHVKINAPPGGKTSISIFGSDSTYGQEIPKGRKGGYENQNTRPTFMAQSSAPQEATYSYSKPAPVSYGGGYGASPSPFRVSSEPTFGARPV